MGEVESRDQLVWRVIRQVQDNWMDRAFITAWDKERSQAVWWTIERGRAGRFTQVEAAALLLILTDRLGSEYWTYGSEDANAG